MTAGAHKNVYQKNFTLIAAFWVLITVTLIIALIIAYNLTSRYVENEFNLRKVDVLERAIKPYNDFFQNRIPEITSYQGLLVPASAASYASSVFNDYTFVKSTWQRNEYYYFFYLDGVLILQYVVLVVFNWL